MTCGVFTTPTPPSFLVFGRKPIAFGDVPPLEEPQDCPDATKHFGIRKKISERAQKAVQAVHFKIAARYQEIFSGKRYAKGRRFGSRCAKPPPKKPKRSWTWFGPCEVLKHILEG